MKKHIAVIGAGLAGTVAASKLLNYGYKVTILEKNDYVGGRIRTVLDQDVAIEMGAAFLTDFYTNLLGNLHSNRMAGKLYKQKRISGIVRNGKVHLATLSTVLSGRVLPWSAKWRALSLGIKAIRYWRSLDQHDFSKASFLDGKSVEDLRRSKNDDYIDYLLQPMLDAFFYWQPDQVSEAMMLTLVKGTALKGNTYKLAGGLSQIPERLVGGVQLLLGSDVTSVEKDSEKGLCIKYGRASKSHKLQVDGIVFATTASAIPKIFRDLNSEQRNFFSNIKYSSTVLMAKKLKRSQISTDIGLAFSSKEQIGLAAVTIGPEANPSDDAALLRVYASGGDAGQYFGQTNEAIVKDLLSKATPFLAEFISGDISQENIIVQKWPEAIPLFDKGHLKRLKSFKDGNIEDPATAIVYAGDYIGGPFMEGAYTSGRDAADRLHKVLGSF